MALRRKSKPAQTELDAITDRLDRVERAVQTSRQPGPTSMQSVDTDEYEDPAPWETIIHWPGTHTPAAATDTFKYYHPGDTAIGGSTPAGWKTPIPPTASVTKHDAVVVATRLASFTQGSGSVQFSDIDTNNVNVFGFTTISVTNDAIKIMRKGPFISFLAVSPATVTNDWGVSTSAAQIEPINNPLPSFNTGQYNGLGLGAIGYEIRVGLSLGTVGGPSTLRPELTVSGSKTFNWLAFCVVFLDTDFVAMDDIL